MKMRVCDYIFTQTVAILANSLDRKNGTNIIFLDSLSKGASLSVMETDQEVWKKLQQYKNVT